MHAAGELSRPFRSRLDTTKAERLAQGDSESPQPSTTWEEPRRTANVGDKKQLNPLQARTHSRYEETSSAPGPTHGTKDPLTVRVAGPLRDWGNPGQTVATSM